MLNAKLIEKNKKQLEQEKIRLEKLLSRVTDKNGQPKYPDYGRSEDDNAAEFTVYETNIAEEYDIEKKLELVTAALKRIRDGVYGICQGGGEEITSARLEAAPEAANCVEHDAKTS